MKYFKYTNKGPRKVNEDSLYILQTSELIYASIADGVGGMKYGQFASSFLVNEFEIFCKNNLHPDLNSFLNKANDDLVTLAKNKFKVENIATTFTAGVISNKLIQGVHVGDSRICVLRENGIKQLTQDHNEIGRLMREGKIDSNNKKYYPRKNIIENVVGIKELFKIQNFEFNLINKDRILFSTDGFHETISKMEIRDISVKFKSVEEFGRKLVVEVENRILHDNTTFICIEI